MTESKLKTAVKVILPVWLIVKIFAGLFTLLTLGGVDLSVFNPAIETAFQVFIFFINNTTTGLVIFIAMIALSLFGTALGFFVAHDSRNMNRIGFIAYMALIVTDILSACILAFSDSLFILSIAMNLLIFFCLICYRKWILPKRDAEQIDAENPDGEDDENNS